MKALEYRMRAVTKQLLSAAFLLAEYWIPGVLGGDYSAGDFRWTVTRALALALLIGLVIAGLWLARLFEVRTLWLGPGLVASSAAVVALGMMISAAWVHVPPFPVLWIAAGVTLVPILSGGHAAVAIVSTAVAAALVDFWMACVPPY